MNKTAKLNESNEYRHPSYGLVTITRQAGGKDNLFGTMESGYSTVALRISRAVVSHNIEHGSILTHGEERLIEINLSALQWAQLVAGIEECPCTLSWFGGKFIAANPEPITRLKLIQDEFKNAMVKLGKLADEIVSAADELQEKPNITKADRKRYRDLAGNVAANIVATQPHIMSKIALTVEHMIAESKANRAAAPGS